MKLTGVQTWYLGAVASLWLAIGLYFALAPFVANLGFLVLPAGAVPLMLPLLVTVWTRMALTSR